MWVFTQEFIIKLKLIYTQNTLTKYKIVHRTYTIDKEGEKMDIPYKILLFSLEPRLRLFCTWSLIQNFESEL